VGWIELLVVGAAGLASMRAAIDAGDVDEAARQGVLAGPTVIEQALAAPDRAAQLAGIAAAPHADDRLELLEALAQAAGRGDRRVALPAAAAARDIARELAHHDLPDDVAAEDLAAWRDAFARLAFDPDRFIELRLLALDTAITLDPQLELAAGLTDSDPAFRRGAIAMVAIPVPARLRPALATVVAKDLDSEVALAAASVLCADLATDPAAPILDALGSAGLQRIRSLVQSRGSASELRNATRCLTADRKRGRP
jgi:hypothetical protein